MQTNTIRALRPSLRRLALAGAVLLAGGVALPGHARAQLVSYTDPADYSAAAPGSTTYTFSGAAAGTTFVGSSYTDGPLTFAASHLFLANYGDYGPGVTDLGEYGGPETITLSGASALSFTLGTYDGPDTIAISVNGAAATTVTETGVAPDTMFVGFTDTVPITSLSFTNATSPDSEIDVIQFQVAPEPSPWALLGVGAAALGLTLRRQRRRTARA